MGNELDRRLELATAASIEAGTFALSELRARSGLEVRQKNPREFVSDLDAATEEHIRHHLAQQYPNDDVQGEELGGAQTDAYWCIDPIDGTANFLRGSPLWGGVNRLHRKRKNHRRRNSVTRSRSNSGSRRRVPTVS